MKKQIISVSALLLSVIIVFSLASCSGIKPIADDDAPLIRDDDAGRTAPPTDSEVSVPDFASIMAGTASTDTVWGEQNAAAQQEIIDAAKLDGYDVSFGADGSMTVVGEDGTVVVQNPDGTWTARNEDGSTAQFGGNWPDNEFTRLVPKPDFKLTGASTTEDQFTAAFQSVTVDQVRAYAEKVKAKGFTVDAEEEDQNVYGVVIYTYTAYNTAGYRAEISFAAGTCSITISK
ncbi:MAG: hypothetical protein KIG36_06940 [Eubacteriales bacterium]|nr:hypothetical protein [Eubacteriales bacterium]